MEHSEKDKATIGRIANELEGYTVKDAQRLMMYADTEIRSRAKITAV